MQEKTDEDIAVQVCGGNSNAFGILVERYERKITRYAKRFLFNYRNIDDAVQDVFIKAYINIQGFDTNRKFSPWIYRIAHNEFINLIKKTGKEPLPLFDPDTLFPYLASNERTDKGLNDQEVKEEIEKCLGKLSPNYREPLVLYYFEDMDYKTIADVLKIPISTVGVRINRGKKILRKIYDKTILKLE